MINNNKNLLTITSRDLFFIHRKLLYIAVVIFISHCSVMAIKYGLGNDILLGIVPLFDFYEEQNIPTYFSTFNLLLTAILLHYISQIETISVARHRTAWRVLGTGFLFMSLDEFSDLRMLFKNIIGFIQSNDNLDATSLGFAVAWTIPVTIIVAVLAVYFLPFLLSLRRAYSINFSIAGVAFVIAALGLENVQGFHMFETKGVRDIYFMALVTIEESLEIFSILYFQYFLIRYINENAAKEAA